MNLLKISSKFAKPLSKIAFKVKNASPTLFVIGGGICVVAGTVMACRATTKVSDIVADHQETMNSIRITSENLPEEYTDKDKKVDTAITYSKTIGELVKLYFPAVALEAGGLALILTSHGIMKKRNAALLGAYNVLSTKFKEYHQRVTEKLGEQDAFMLKNGLKCEKISVADVDPETGEQKTYKSKELVREENTNLSIYSRFFDECSAEWTKSPDYNRQFLQAQENIFNDQLQAKGHVFLNEVYDALGFDRTSEGAVVGWVAKDNPECQGDGYISFGMFKTFDKATRSFVNGYEPTILLDFNVDGVIWDKI